MPKSTSKNNLITFEALVSPHLEALYRSAYRFTGSSHDSEDLIQDLLIKLYPKFDELKKIEKLRPWLMRVMYRLFIDNKRKYKRSPIHLVIDNRDEDPPGDPMDEIAHPQKGPEEQIDHDKDLQQLTTALDRLGEDHRTVVMLHDIEGYRLEEMSTILDCPVGTLKSRLHRARARLRELLGDLSITKEQK